MYKITRKKGRQNEICRRMREAKARKHAALAAELGPRKAMYTPPELRRVVIVIDYDFETKIDVFKLTRSPRIDRYHITHNNNPATGAGWANFCKRLGTHYPRILSPLAIL